ncbi:hypothetical protein [Ralstonia solanacearum]|uniref:hypothetical protein n=1 Tax=Ralstonia solanacearum TaxID=305 RepID=UPI0001D9626E|nr:hypothetical protein [Ralstonia solanacearum]CBJ35169.1 type III effector [Ralstonia solanacearum PSI07]
MSHSKVKLGGHGSSGIGNDFTPTKTPAPSTPAPQPQQINDLLNRGVGNAINKTGFGSDSQTWTPGSTIVSLKSRSSSGSKPGKGGSSKSDETSGGKRKREDETDPSQETDDAKKKKKKRDDEENSSQAGGGSPSAGSGGGTPEDALMNIVMQRAIQRQTQTRQKMQDAMKIKDDDD